MAGAGVVVRPATYAAGVLVVVGQCGARATHETSNVRRLRRRRSIGCSYHTRNQQHRRACAASRGTVPFCATPRQATARGESGERTAGNEYRTIIWWAKQITSVSHSVPLRDGGFRRIFHPRHRGDPGRPAVVGGAAGAYVIPRIIIRRRRTLDKRNLPPIAAQAAGRVTFARDDSVSVISSSIGFRLHSGL
jgi:hypothetical protein